MAYISSKFNQEIFLCDLRSLNARAEVMSFTRATPVMTVGSTRDVYSNVVCTSLLIHIDEEPLKKLQFCERFLKMD